jgi:hypothetical protein
MFNRMAEISEDPSSKRELIDLAKRIADAAKVCAHVAEERVRSIGERCSGVPSWVPSNQEATCWWYMAN